MEDSALSALWASRLALLDGFLGTMSASAISLMFGIVVGGIAAIGLVWGPMTVVITVNAFVYVLRGLPLLVTILFAYFGIGALWPSLSAFWTSIFAMSLFAGAQLAEVFRGAIQAISPAQIEAAKSIGLPFWARLRFVILPLALRRAIPSATNIAIDLLKSSTLISALGARDLFLAGQQVAMRTLFIPETYLFLWAAYLLVCFIVALLGQWLEQRFAYIIF